MAYLPTGDSLSTVADAAKVGLAVVQDPALPEVTRLLLQLVAIENDGKAPSSGGPSSLSKGIGLKYAVTPIKMAVAVRKQPWLLVAVGGGLLATVFMLGVATGRPSR